MTGRRLYDPKLVQIYGLVSRFAGALVALIALLICIGWIFSISQLEITGAGTALSFLSYAVALLLLIGQNKKRPRLIIGHAFVLIGITIALLNVGRFFWGWDLLSWVLQGGSDDLAVFLAVPGQNDAIELVVFGVALLLLDFRPRSRVRPCECLALACTLIALVTLLGFIFGANDLCLFISCVRISTMAAALFCVLSFGLLLARTDSGLLSLLSRPDAGGMSVRVLMPIAILTPLAVGWLHMEAERTHVIQKDMGYSVMFVLMLLVYLVTLWYHAVSLSRVDAARRDALENLEKNEKRTRMILQQAIDAFVAVDRHGIVKDWNGRAAVTFGYSGADALGKSVLELIVPERYREIVLRETNQMLASQVHTTIIPSKPIEATVMHQAGYEFPVEISLFPVLMDNERLVCAFIRDITERKEIEQRFKDFYSTVTHELRSPLTSIMGSIELLQERYGQGLPEAANRALAAGATSCERLLRLIKDLLDVKRVQEGKLALEIKRQDPLRIIDHACAELQGLLDQAGVKLQVVLEESDFFLGDTDRVVQVLANLISNAIKFSKPGSTVTVKTERNASRIRFSVIDQGPGIPADQLHRLFSQFGQLGDKEGIEKKMGTGLGLAISKAIIEEHRGYIGLDSVPGQGSTFWFELALAAASPSQSMVPPSDLLRTKP